MSKLRMSSNENLVADIIDQEGDPVKCLFHNDNGIVIKTGLYPYINFSKENLLEMVRLIDEAEIKYREM